MILRVIFASLLISILVSDSLAQIEEYNYQEYRQANTRLRQLNFIPMLAGRNQKVESPIFDDFDRFNAAELDLGFDYLDLWNAPHLQNRLSASFNIAPNLVQTKTDDDKTDRLGVRQNFIVDWTRDHYEDYNGWFWGWDVLMFQSARLENETIEGMVDIEENQSRLSARLNPRLRFGYGRLENITGAWQAYRLLQRFKYLEISGDFDISEVNAFGNFIDGLRAMRVFDARLTYIAQLKLLDSYLSYDLGLDPVQSISYFAELNDMWRFGISENRVKGKKLSFSLGPAGSTFWSRTETNGNESDSRSFDIGATLQVDYFVGRPLKADKQFNWGGGFNVEYASIMNDPNPMGSEDYSQVAFQPYANVMWGYYPTTRTEYELSADLGYLFTRRSFDGLTPSESDNGLTAILNGRMRYWFSPRTTLVVDVNFQYGQTIIPLSLTALTPRDNYDLTYGVSLTQAIF